MTYVLYPCSAKQLQLSNKMSKIQNKIKILKNKIQFTHTVSGASGRATERAADRLLFLRLIGVFPPVGGNSVLFDAERDRLAAAIERVCIARPSGGFRDGALLLRGLPRGIANETDK